MPQLRAKSTRGCQNNINVKLRGTCPGKDEDDATTMVFIVLACRPTPSWLKAGTAKFASGRPRDPPFSAPKRKRCQGASGMQHGRRVYRALSGSKWGAIGPCVPRVAAPMIWARSWPWGNDRRLCSASSGAKRRGADSPLLALCVCMGHQNAQAEPSG